MSSPFERLWKDKMDIYRYVSSIVNGVTKSSESKLYSAVKCHYSGGQMVDTDNVVPAIVNSHKLFCAVATDLKSGDKVIITQRNGNVVTLSIGEGFPYGSGQQFNVKRSDVA